MRGSLGREETKDRTLSLYNSLNKTHYTDPEDITITTIEDVIYMGMKNDLSYIVSDRSSLYDVLNINEHQSTYNPNIPIREFMYAARLYDKYLKSNNKNPYSSSIIPLPVPKLVELYNGKIDMPDDSVMKLSDAFKEEIRQGIIKNQKVNINGNIYADDIIIEENLEREVEEILKMLSPDIEVSVRVININYGHSKEVLSECKALNEYAWLVEQIRKNLTEGIELEKATNKALDEMPEDYELKSQLMEHRAEVVGMWISEYNEEETMRLFKEEGRQEGRQEGRREGRQEGVIVGENLFISLIKKLMELGRDNEIKRATDDEAYREKLYLEFGLKKSVTN